MYERVIGWVICLGLVVFTPGATRSSCRVAIGIPSASVEATQLDMGIGSAPEGANLGTGAEAPESGNGHTGIKTLYIAL